jgi:hypothetical protein
MKKINSYLARSFENLCANTFMTKEIIVKNGNYMIQDVVFKKWLQKTLF